MVQFLMDRLTVSLSCTCIARENQVQLINSNYACPCKPIANRHVRIPACELVNSLLVNCSAWLTYIPCETKCFYSIRPVQNFPQYLRIPNLWAWENVTSLKQGEVPYDKLFSLFVTEALQAVLTTGKPESFEAARANYLNWCKCS